MYVSVRWIENEIKQNPLVASLEWIEHATTDPNIHIRICLKENLSEM